MLLLYGFVDRIVEKTEENKRSAESLAGRVLLDRALEACGVNAISSYIRKEDNGKPYLEGHPEIDFNITHSNGFVACILSVGEGRVGIDAEPQNTPYSKEKQMALACRFFGESERMLLEKGEMDFSELWTRREAYLKMTGEGFAAGAKRICPTVFVLKRCRSSDIHFRCVPKKRRK